MWKNVFGMKIVLASSFIINNYLFLIFQEMHEMDKFWKKVGLVEMRNLQLIAERNSLLEQNKQLEEELKNRITCQTTNIEFIVAVVTE